MRKARTAGDFQALLTVVLVAGFLGCGEPRQEPTPDGETADTKAPTLVDSSQSATEVRVRGPVTFRVNARDEESPTLRFSWTASLGTLGAPSETGTSSEIAWTPLPARPRAPW